MTEQQSFTKLEREQVPQLRDDLDAAESTEDVRKFFAYNVRHLLMKVMMGEVEVLPDDIQLNPDAPPYYRLGPGLKDNSRFVEISAHSDLPQILERFAEASAHRYLHLDKNPEKTERKIYHGRDGLTQTPGEARK